MKIIHPTPINRAIALRVRSRQAPLPTDQVGAGQSPLHPDMLSWVGADPNASGEERAEKDPATLAPDPEHLAYIEEHLERGETHYTTRPGLVELRSHVAAAVARMKVSDPGVDGVVITSGEGEALFATLLSLDVVNGGKVHLVGHHGRHEALLAMLGVVEAQPDDPDLAELPRVVCLWRAVSTARGRRPEGSRPDDLFVGTLDGLPGMPAFRLGFAVGPPDRIKKVMMWKQAWSICSPGPSQRAGIFAFDAAALGGAGGSEP